MIIIKKRKFQIVYVSMRSVATTTLGSGAGGGGGRSSPPLPPV
jgi:hypothetical protein